MKMIQSICQPIRRNLRLLLAVGYIFISVVFVNPAAAFVKPESMHPSRTKGPRVFSLIPAAGLYALSNNKNKVTSLPPGVSPFEKSLAKRSDIQGTFRTIAAQALGKALKDRKQLLEIDVPPFIGGDQSKSQFDDYDNIQELDSNRDWCVQWVPLFSINKISSNVWFILPDDKECELAKNEWTGQRFRKSMKFTSIRAVCEALLTENAMKSYQKAWGSSFAERINKLQGGDGILADSSTLDRLDLSDTNRLHLVCQPGNGGPVEDWINVEQIHRSSNLQEGGATIVMNGALDKVRDGYYPALFFPALAKTVPFYRQFEPILFAKPISDKGLYGWLYRVYPEPWQVILQVARPSTKPNDSTFLVENIVVLVADRRPSYAEAINAMVRESAQQSTL
jgi:Domain of unknown function (DUF1995)